MQGSDEARKKILAYASWKAIVRKSLPQIFIGLKTYTGKLACQGIEHKRAGDHPGTETGSGKL